MGENMKKIINLPNFRLEEIDTNNEEHFNLIKAFDRDELAKKYLFPYKPSFYDLVNESISTDNIFNTFYIIYFKNRPIGYVEIESPNTTYLNYALLHSERKKGYASMFLRELSIYLLENYKEVNSVNAIIRKNNSNSINAVKRAGLSKIEEDSKFETYRKNR